MLVGMVVLVLLVAVVTVRDVTRRGAGRARRGPRHPASSAPGWSDPAGMIATYR